jgi:glucose/arabinose dehydrogenase
MDREGIRLGALCALAALGAVAVARFPRGMPQARAAAAQVVLADAFPGATFQRPVQALQAPDGSARLFVVEQAGRVWTVEHPAPPPPATAAKRLFLDISSRVSRLANEEGLLGLAFHPDFAANRRFLVHYSAKYADDADRRHRISEFLADADDPGVADASSERVVLALGQPYQNHWGGWLGFGPDGMLFVALGDGGSGGDPGNRAQDLADLHGKILRIDPDARDAGGYGIPADNPFLGRAGAAPEVFAYGLRNPWRCSFDRATGSLWAGDVGQDAWEEVDLVVAGGNYGWRRREGAHDYLPGGPAPADPLRDPVAEVPHSEGRSITGGFVYRGSGIPALAGSYLFADFETGRLWALEDPYGAADRVLLLDTTEPVASFAEDRAGEVFLVSFSGRILAIRDGAPPPPPPDGELPGTLSALGLFADLPRGVPVEGALRYGVIAPLWADGASKDRFLVLPPGGALGWRDGDALAMPVGGTAVKTFARGGARLETRVIRRSSEGFLAASYRWRADLSDADRVDERTAVPGPGGAWTVPSPEDCRACHTDAAGFLLGVTASQLRAATVGAWKRSGVLSGAPAPREVPRLARLRGRGRIERRARSYLDANCASCHRPDDPTGASLDLRFSTPLEETGMLDAPPQHGDLGIADARILAPGDPARSTLVERLRVTGEGRMPGLGTVVPHDEAVRLLRRWIRRVR